jgi:hypothetical protein
MNPSNLYEQYFCGISRKIKTLVTEEVDKFGGLESLAVDAIDNIFQLVLGGIQLFGTEQYEQYLKASPQERLDIITEVYTKECYIYYKVSSKLKPYEVIANVKGTVYEPVKEYIRIPTEGETDVKWNHRKAMIAPQYIILLAKTPESYLACSSAKTNHFDLPVSVGPKKRQNTPYRNSPFKVLSETETRLYAAYVGRRGLAEMKDRANSLSTHRLMYRNILMADKPTDIPTLVDREQHPFGTDKTIEIVESILNASGIDLEYVPEKNEIS